MPASTIVAGSPAGQSLVVVPIDAASVDLTYHRPVDQRWVARRAADYDPDRYQAPTLSQRPSGLRVVDGAATLAMAGLVGFTHAHARVLDGLAYEDEVRLYLDLNAGRRPMTALEKHCALLAIGEPIALAIEDVLASNGLSVSAAQGKLSITAVSTLRYAWGAAGTARDHRLVSPRTLQAGIDALTWAVVSLKPLVDKGESASLVYSKLNLNAMLWLYRNAEAFPDALTMGALLGKESVYSLRIAVEDFSRSKRERNGVRLANHLNAAAPSPVIELPAAGDSPDAED